ncbi:hypothetical protein [Embleya sp. AB8]|uniref:hypothetical protein n=1 Tax=Embleya sp. AB8 TaxID=3156304 RepID=UPI003C739C72
MKRCVLASLWATLAVQSIWLLTHGADVFGVAVLVLLGGFAAASGRRPWLGIPIRALMAGDFLRSVGARFGAFGGPGTPGVTWGDFAHFTTYTRQVASFLPSGAAPTLAVLATIAETTLGLALLFGIRLRWTALGAAGLLLSFGISMTVSRPASEQFHYCVFALAAGMLQLATTDRHPLSTDNLLARIATRHHHRRAHPSPNRTAAA